MCSSGFIQSAPRREDDESRELQLLLRLQRDLKQVGSFDRLMHVALRLMAPHFDAPDGIVLKPGRVGKPYIVHQIGARKWDLERVAEIFATGRTALPPEMLYTAFRERERTVAVLLLGRGAPFGRADLRALQRLALVVSERLDTLSETRVVEVLARIERKISSELSTVDLLYQILDGLQLLVHYDHSGSILLLDAERSQLVVRAEKIAWRKMKSPHIHDALEFEPGMGELLHDDSRGFLMGAGDAGASTHALDDAGDVPTAPLVSRARLKALYEKLCYACRTGLGPPEASMLVVPLLFGNRLLGLLKLSSVHASAFTPGDVRVVGRFIEKMSTAIRNANLYERRLDELRAINEIGQLVTRPLPLEETCQSILEIVLRVMNLHVGSIELLDRDQGRLRVLASYGYSIECAGLDLGEGITGEVARTGKPIVANDVVEHPSYVLRFPDVRSELAVPITFEGVTLGVLNVESYTRNRFRERDVEFLSILADRTATALETLEQREHRRATLQLLYELSAKLAVPEDARPLLQLTVDLTRQHLSCEVASIFLFEEGLYRRCATAGLPQEWFAEESFSSGEGLTGRAAVLRPGSYPKPVVENTVQESGEALPAILRRYREKLPSGRIAHLIAVPLVEGDRPIGNLRVINRTTLEGSIAPGGFTKTDVTLLSTIASQVSVALADFRKRERIREMSAELEKQVQERTEEVQRLASFVENAPLAIFWIDAEGALQFINEAGEKMFGYQADELRGRRVDDEGSGILGTQLPHLEQVVGFMSNWTGEIECRRSDGSIFPVYLSARALAGTSGDTRGMVVFARDATATKELELQLLESEGKRAMADLAGGVAHDVNNALGSSLPMIQALRDDLEQQEFDQGQFLEDLRQIESYTRISVRIFQGMLSMARGTFAIDQVVQVNERVETAMDLLSFKLEKARVEVNLELASNIPEILAHPGRLEQAFHNLILNSIDAMPEGGTLTLRTWNDGDCIVAEVEDTGEGIPQELLDRVEEPFYTSKRHGTGLGLSVVRSIVWEHDGKMMLRSKAGEGTTVRIELPVTGRTRESARVEET
ncbi:MAG: GAF domain-containing protein [Candidatus Krumholzibacteriia bacterium]